MGKVWLWRGSHLPAQHAIEKQGVRQPPGVGAVQVAAGAEHVYTVARLVENPEVEYAQRLAGWQL